MLPTSAQAVTLNFDSLNGMVNKPIWPFPSPPPARYAVAATVPNESRVSDQFLASDGVVFSSDRPYIAVVDITTGDISPNHAPSVPNAIGGVANNGKLSYSAPIIGNFFLPSDPSVKATTDFVSASTDTRGIRGLVLLEAFGTEGQLLGSTSAIDLNGPILSLSLPGIHSFRLTGDGTAAFDDITFNEVTANQVKSVPEPSSVLGLLAFGALGSVLLKRKKAQVS
jgi:hypothetical protein